jgi:DNA polymerase-3 subunit epsilon
MAQRSDREYVAFDLETTGLRAATDRIVEFGAVRFDTRGQELARFESLVDPGCPMSPGALAVHGISDQDLVGAPPASAILPQFLEFLGDPAGTTLLAHNACFDAAFLGHELGRIECAPPGHAVVDTLALARARLPRLANHRLDTLARALGLDPDGPHRALADSRRVQGLFLALGGPQVLPEGLVAYPVLDVRRPAGAPCGWDTVVQAIAAGRRLRMEYQGGTRGDVAREVTPRGFVNRGGVAYLVAYCHLDALEKSFRLDRVIRYEVVP